MTLVQADYKDRFDVFTSRLDFVEIADSGERAILSIPLMHVGPNKKHLYWTEEMLKKVTPMFRGVTFRYDLNGGEGSSHTTNKLSSPHYDIGWTYEGKDGAWYDTKTKSMWVKGEVTHPDVIEKLRRQTSNGRREVNFASMGIIVEKAVCSICGAEFGTCEHIRGEKYNGETCYKVPTECSKALHVALTNDPADGEADIAECIFQELNSEDKVYNSEKSKAGDTQMSPNEMQNNGLVDNQMPGGMAAGNDLPAKPAISPEKMILELAERIKSIEQKMNGPNPEVINSAPQDRFTQANMGTTTQFEKTKTNEEDVDMTDKKDAKEGQVDNTSAPVNPPAKNAEMQDAGSSKIDQIMSLLQELLSRFPAAETQDLEQLKNAGKENMNEAEMVTAQKPPGDMVKDNDHESNNKNIQHIDEPDKVATADSEVDTLKSELADMKESMKKLAESMELQDNTNVPEFGGSNAPAKAVEVADMSAEERHNTFGDYGKWDAIWNGAESAKKFN